MMSKLIALLFSVVAFHARADLRPYHLKINLSAEKQEVKPGEILPLWLEFVNPDSVEHSYLLPSNTPSRKKIVFFSVFTVDENNFYSEVYRENVQIEIDTTLQVHHNLKNIKGGEGFVFPVIFNDEKNYNFHIEAHHRLSNLPPGDYQILAWYQPWNSDMADLIYNPISPFGHDESDNPVAHKLDMPTFGMQSNYLSLRILPDTEKTQEVAFSSTKACPNNCSFCRKIEKNKWRRVKRSIKRQTNYRNKWGVKGVDTNWQQVHRNVAFLGPEPSAILASLPTWTGRNIIFKNEEGYHYYTLTWQLGKIHKIRSKLAYPFYWIGFSGPPFKTSAVHCRKLVVFKPY